MSDEPFICIIDHQNQLPCILRQRHIHKPLAKVTEIYYMADDFYKEFAKILENTWLRCPLG